jgi:uncharacterized protein YidB (DUF937 family)
MSILDSLLGQGDSAGAGAGNNALDMLQGLLGQAGGLSGLLGQLEQGGLGAQVQSWIATGSNQPVSAETLGAALQSGPLAGVVQQLAGKFGLDPAQLVQQLSGVLPQVVDQLTPDGQVPADSQGLDLGALAGLAGSLFKR